MHYHRVRPIAAALSAIKNTLYIHKLLREAIEHGILDKYNEEESVMLLSMPLIILEDNKAAIDWANKLTSTQRMRHVERSLYWMRQFVGQKKIQLKHIKSENQLANI
jgi:hypothetical protein